MKKLRTVAVAIMSLVSCSNPYQNVENKETDYAIIPQPVSLQSQTGKFLVNNETVVMSSDALSPEANNLAELLKIVSGKSVSFNEGGNAGSNTIQLKIDETIKNGEGYRLSVTYDKVTVSGSSPQGVFYGIQTLRQLLPSSQDIAGSDITIPAVEIEDFPRYSYRGMHLDVARHFFPVDFIKKYINLIALHKMNTFHWHLTEDQGWRIEINKYPELTKVGAWRNGTIIGHYTEAYRNDQTRYGGFYTQEEIKEIVAYAAERHIAVIPEIELPGHSGAAIASYPYLSCFPEEPTIVRNDLMSEKSKELQKAGTVKVVQETWGVMDDVYCAGKEETFEFLEGVLEEVVELFPSAYIHIGGDECPKGNWERCPHCKRRKKEEGLADAHELQSYFIQRMEKFLNSKGKNIIGWDEILEGGLAPNATVMSWRGINGGIEAAKQHHNVIMTPTSSNYFDYYQSKSEDEPLAIGGFLPVEQVYAYEPTPEELSAEEAKYILGTQGNVWTEYMKTSDYVEYMALPRLTALSEVAWSQKEAKDWNGFKRRLIEISKLYDDLGYNYAK